MAKRLPAFKEFGRSTKKPKLDVSVNKGRPLGPSQTWPHHMPTNAAEIGRACDNAARNSLSNNNLWDDDDDDVILLATQVAESQVAMKNVAAQQVNITDSDITFSEFAPHVHATTSTQRITMVTNTCATAAVKATVSAPTLDKNSLSELFADDDDFAEILTEAVNNEKIEQSTKRNNVFKKPTAIMSAVNGGNNIAPLVSNVPHTQIQESQNTAARRQVATERQVKLLMERLDTLKAENAKLTKDLSESKAKIESKDGESSLLRDELRHMKQQMQTLKMEKLMSTEAAKSECKTKLAELAKRVEAKESELKLRNAEYSVLKMRHADETQRLEMSIRNANATTDAPMEIDAEQTQNKSSNHMLYRLRTLTLLSTNRASLKSQQHNQLTTNAYERSQERGASKRQHTPFQEELANAQTLLAQLQIAQQQRASWTTTEQVRFSENAIKSVCSALPEFWTYVHGLEFPKHCNVHPYHDYELRKDELPTSSLSRKRDLLSAHELHADERAISLRRYIAAVSVMCAQAPNFAQQLLKQQHGDYALLQVACQAISKLGYSREICAHFGALEAFARLLRVLLQQQQQQQRLLDTAVDEHIELLVDALLKQLIFVRPSAWIFRELSYCILELTRLPSALARLCVNSDESTFYSDRMRSIYRFSNDSCILQVYAGLLEIAFPLNGELSVEHFRLLAVICENHVRFAYFCFMKPPDFIHKLLPAYDDDDEDDDDADAEGDVDGRKSEMSAQQVNLTEHQQLSNTELTATNSNNTNNNNNNNHTSPTAAHCECYTKLCLSVVTLLFQLVRQWQGSGRKVETPRVAEISQIGVQLLYTIFCDNYSTRLFRYAEETTKHYLWLICEWWTENVDTLKFNSVQKNFLNKLRDFHIMPKQLKEEGNCANLINDLNEWHTLTNDARTTTAHGNISDATVAANFSLVAVEKLKIMDNAGDATKFFEGLKGYAFNFE